MNIFVIDADPVVAAKMLCDKHIVKMPIESAQMLGYINNLESTAPHAKHPCTLWAAKSAANYTWLVLHGIALCDEYTRRYGKTHASKAVIEKYASVPEHVSETALTEFVQCMPERYKDEDPVYAYRKYYHSKFDIAKWNHSNKPEWYIGMLGILYPERIERPNVLVQ